jgi:hypothetical protein
MSPLTNLIVAIFRYDAFYETDQHKNMSVITNASSILGASMIACVLLVPSAGAEEMHPMLESKYWAKAGGFFASRDLNISVAGTAGVVRREVDFDEKAGLDDTSDLFMTEFGWQFGEKWGLAFQHFRSSRSAQWALSADVEWEDVVYEAGVDVAAHSSMRITRLFFSRHVWDKGPHDLRLGAGLHLIDTGFSISGVATLDDMSKEFQANVVAASFPFPNIGAWYRYSLSDRWLFHARADWLSASTSDYGGGIWNTAAGVDFALTKHLGFGLAYEFFEINGTVKEDTWRGELHSRYEGFMLSLDGFW